MRIYIAVFISIVLMACSIIKPKDGYAKIGGVDGGHYLKIIKKNNNYYQVTILNERKEVIKQGYFKLVNSCCNDCSPRELLKKIDFYDNNEKIYLITENNRTCFLEFVE